ncbi:hypothetical protein NC652_007037 [Populus alba x Populus x berolinensis]|nr:hypothetical protein NC652_007037 [Populus alba x Populus x berolinensis]
MDLPILFCSLHVFFSSLRKQQEQCLKLQRISGKLKGSMSPAFPTTSIFYLSETCSKKLCNAFCVFLQIEKVK